MHPGLKRRMNSSDVNFFPSPSPFLGCHNCVMSIFSDEFVKDKLVDIWVFLRLFLICLFIKVVVCLVLLN